jgi:hypothetical protein
MISTIEKRFKELIYMSNSTYLEGECSGIRFAIREIVEEIDDCESNDKITLFHDEWLSLRERLCAIAHDVPVSEGHSARMLKIQGKE